MSTAKVESEIIKYISARKVMVVDPSTGSRAGIGGTMVNLGAKSENVKLCADFETAETLMPVFKPDIVICEYDLNGRCGLDLLQEQRRAHPESKKSIFIMVTSNSSQSAVAQAAEEDIDNYILKPYTIETLCNAIVRAGLAKTYPSPYYLMIEEGKLALFEGNAERAMDLFEKAMPMDPKPTLACFYHGQAHLLKQALEPARESYNLGLSFNKIHYKCLTGLFDILMKKSMHHDAYQVVKRIARYFPSNPQRLITVLRLAVVTNSYEDIEHYYQVFTSIDTRSEELMRYLCAALVICGKYYMREDSKKRALVLYEKAALYAATRPPILREIMVSLLQEDMFREAAGFLKHFSPSTFTSSEYLAMKYVIHDDRVLPVADSVKVGETLLKTGVADPEVYRALIARYAEAGQKSRAKELVEEGVKLWPDRQADFENVSAKRASVKPSDKPAKRAKK